MIYDSTRNAYFDNAKAILITLVVIGHIIQPFIAENHTLKTLFIFIYSFHMPAFTLLSGHFSKYIKNLTRAEIKYLLLFLASTLLYWPLAETDLLVMLAVPFFVLWYLVSLTSWYVLLQFFRKFKHPIIMSIIIAIIAGYVPGINEAVSASRTLVLFPFFLVGYYMTSTHFERFKNSKQLIAVGVLIAIFIGLWFADINHNWIFNCFSYAALGFQEWYAGIYRVGLLLIYSLALACFMIVVPSDRTPVTWIGKHTLMIFLSHGPLILLYYSYLSNHFLSP